VIYRRHNFKNFPKSYDSDDLTKTNEEVYSVTPKLFRFFKSFSNRRSL